MKTTTTIKVFAYPVTIKDHRCGTFETDTIVIPAEWLRICGSMGLDICDDKHLIYRAYNRKGYEVLEIGNRHKITLSIDLERLYTEQNNVAAPATLTGGMEVTIND